MYKNKVLFNYFRSALLITLFLIPSLAQLQAQSPGDVNSDSVIDIVDALLIAQYYVGLNPQNFYETYGDVDCSNSINIIRIDIFFTIKRCHGQFGFHMIF